METVHQRERWRTGTGLLNFPLFSVISAACHMPQRRGDRQWSSLACPKPYHHQRTDENAKAAGRIGLGMRTG